MPAMLNPNVKTFYAFTATQSFGRGIWMGNILSLYIVILAEASTGVLGLSPNELLGATSAVTGVAMLVSVLPGGLLADRWSIKGTMLLAAAAGLSGLAVLSIGEGLLPVIIGLFLWGIFQGLSRPAAETLLANSTVSGERSGIYARAHFIDQMGMGSGPLLNIILFFFLGDRWELGILRTVMSFGMIFSGLSAVMMLNMKTSHALGDESEAFSSTAAAATAINPAVLTSSGSRNPADAVQESDPGAGQVAGQMPGKQIASSARKLRLHSFIPHIFLASSFIIGFGAGMTVKFFPVFFRSVYGFSPIAVQAVMGVGLLLTGLATVWAQKRSLHRGRAEMIIALQAVAIACLFGLSLYPPAWLMVLLFMIRGALMNATTPLSRSIVMDYVPKKRRGLWNSLQSVAWGLFWNVSALLGGFIIGDDRFNLIFQVTAGIYILGTAIIIPLAGVIRREVSGQ